jgi:hypothetical protein
MRFDNDRSITKIGIFTDHLYGQNALYLICVHLHFKKFPAVKPPDPHFTKAGKGRGRNRNGRQGIKGRGREARGRAGRVVGGDLLC